MADSSCGSPKNVPVSRPSFGGPAIDAAGFGPLFNHGLGHGVGLEIHEAPFMRPNSDATLEAGMVITLEPGIYLPDELGVRIEDDILITPDGPEMLTSVPQTPAELAAMI